MEVETFEIIFLDEDRTTVLDKQMAKAGDTVQYKGKVPTKEPTSQETYIFDGWIGEEKLENVQENLVLVAKYIADVKKSVKDAMYNASLQNAESSTINATLEAGKKVDAQKIALEKDTRITAEIVSDIMQNGKTEIGQEMNKDNLEK